MSLLLFTVLGRLHGLLGVLALALLAHPVLSKRNLRLWERGAIGLIAAAGLSGMVIYPAYRRLHKPDLLERAPDVALAFEWKEHVAAFALCLALGAALAEGALAKRLLAGALAAGLLVAGLGVWVGSVSAAR
jgi:hypothetical protein